MYGFSFGPDDFRLWGLTPSERAAGLFARAGLQVAESLSDLEEDERVVCLNCAYVFEPAFVGYLVNREDWILHDQAAGEPMVCGALRAADLRAVLDGRTTDRKFEKQDLAELESLYHGALRRRTTTLVYRQADLSTRDIEWRLYSSSYKGVTDFVTKYLWPVPAFWLTRLACRLGLSPNFVTTLSLILVLAATYLFYLGAFGWGLLAAWVMAILDTVDGKLARVTLRSSRWGEAYDHGIDLIHPPFWYAAWGFGLAAYGISVSPDWLMLHLSVIIGGYIGGRLLEGLFLLITRQEMWVWRRIDSLFRLVVARRNPNMVLLSLAWLIGRPDSGLLWVSGWTILSLLYQSVRMLQAGICRMQGKTVTSWLSTN